MDLCIPVSIILSTWNEMKTTDCLVMGSNQLQCHIGVYGAIKLTTWEEWVWRNRRSVSCLMLNNHSIKQENVLATHKVHMSILAWVHLFWWTHFSRAKWSTALYTLVTCHGWCWSIARRSPVLLSTGTYSALPLFSLFKPIFWHSMLKCIIGKYENAVQSQHCTVS